MNWLDATVLSAWPPILVPVSTFDRFVFLLVDCELIKGGVIMAAMWGYWFAGPPDIRDAGRTLIIATVAGTFVSLFAARLLAVSLPFRARPVYALAAASGASPDKYLERWSAFPSDHAAVFFALATGLFLLSRRFGTLALLHATLLVSLPRLYLGLHHATDALGGAALGVLFGTLATRPSVREAIAKPLLRSAQQWPGLAYALLFLLTFEFARLFDGVRGLARFVFIAAR